MVHKEDRYISLYSCISLTRGIKRGVILDLHRKEYVEIPIEVCDFLEKIKSKPILLSKTMKEIELRNMKGLVKWLIQNDFIFFMAKNEEIKYFPPISTNHEKPEQIKNAIIDVSDFKYYNLDKGLKDLSDLECEIIQIRLFSIFTNKLIINALELTKGRSFVNIELIIQLNTTINEQFIRSIIDNYTNIVSIIISNSNKNYSYTYKQSSVIFTDKVIDSEEKCGIVNKSSFNCHLDFFNESLFRNNCLYKKVGIDKWGYIKNCPGMNKKFGHVERDSIGTIIQKKDFKKIWNLNKDSVEVCKDCEYRYICQDCRALIKDKKNSLSQPLKCNYNPYIAKWKGEEGFYPVFKSKL